MTGTIISIIIIAFLIFFVVFGWKRGFLRIIFTTLSLVATMIIAAFLLTPVSTFLANNTGMEKSLEESVAKSLGWEDMTLPSEKASDDDKEDSGKEDDGSEDTASKDAGKEDVGSKDRKEETTKPSEEVSGKASEEDDEEKVIMGLKLPEVIKNSILEKNTVSDYIKIGVNNFKQYVVRSVAMTILKIITYIALVIAVFILIRILLKISKFINKVPIIGGVNRFLGAITGFVEGALILWLLCLIISLISHTELGKQITDIISGNAFLTFIYEENLVLRLINSLLTLF